MAKQVGPHYILGTIDDVTYYKMGNGYFMRKKTSLNKTRFHSDPAYAGIPKMRTQNFGRASQLASQVYRYFPRAVKKGTLFNDMTSLAQGLLWKATPPEEVVKQLQAQFAPKPAAVLQQAAAIPPEPVKTTEAAAYPPLPLQLPAIEPHFSAWWVSGQGTLTKKATTSLLQRALQPLRPGWLHTDLKRE